jgi:5-methylcytosine-specific restriction endonuclease McrA
MPSGYSSETGLPFKPVGNKGRIFSEEWKRRLKFKRQFQVRPKTSEETRKKISIANKGKIFSKEYRNKLSEAERGERNHNWKGGITSWRTKVWHSIEYRLWRESVFIRDSYTCQRCYEKNKRHNAHHINNFSEFPEIRTSIENGITLCEKCHRIFHKTYGHRNNNRKQIEEFTQKIKMNNGEYLK